MPDDHPDDPKLPIRLSEWQQLHRLLAMAPHKLGHVSPQQVAGEGGMLVLKFEQPVPVVIDETGGGRTGTGLAAALLHEVRIGGADGIDLRVGDRPDTGTRSHRSTSIRRIVAIEQAL